MLAEFTPYKGRTIQIRQQVAVHRNKHQNCWSILDKPNGHVLGHAQMLMLKNCEFRVYESGHLRALREGQKNVHAYVVGEYFGDLSPITCAKRIAYSMAEGRFIVISTNGTPVSAKWAEFGINGSVWAHKIVESEN